MIIEPRHEKTKVQISCALTMQVISSQVCVRSVSDLVGNPEDRLSHDLAHMYIGEKGPFGVLSSPLNHVLLVPTIFC